MHAHEADIPVALVRTLVDTQFPRYAAERLAPVQSAGTDNTLFRLGSDLVIRLPRVASAVEQIEREQTWLPRLATGLPLRIPEPVAVGRPADGYPWSWSIYRWISGEEATRESLGDLDDAAETLAAFIRALRSLDTTDGPVPGFGRGRLLRDRDGPTRAAIAQLGQGWDARMLLGLWDEMLALPDWTTPAVWVHADLRPGNLLSRDGSLCAVIDFGSIGVGDPAADLIIAWNLFAARSRRRFLSAVGCEDAVRLRGAAWAYSIALVALPYYRETNRDLAGISAYTIREVLSEW